MTDADEEAAILSIANNSEIVIDDQDQIPEVVLLDEDPATESIEDNDVETNGNGGDIPQEEKNEADVQVTQVEEDNPFGDDEDSDEEGGGVQVTIRKIEPTEKPAARQGKLDIDATPMINDKPIYDIDLAQMEDRPWRKPGADITDYFNYGFTEETWNMYCERQKKLRTEFSGNQKAANEALLSSIKIANPLANPVVNNPTSSVVKVLTDNGGRFKANQNNSNFNSLSNIQNEQVIRTVISGNTSTSTAPSNTGSNGMAQSSVMDFTRPPPGLSMPPIGNPSSLSNNISDAPPGVDSGSDRPPGVESAPGTTAAPGIGVPGVPGGLDMHLGIPPMGFNPNLPPPGMPTGMNPMGLLATSLPPPGFNMPPPAFQHSRAGFGTGPVGLGSSAPRSLMSGFPPRESRDGSDDDDERRSSRKRRSRSRSPIRRDRDRDSRRRSDREGDRTSSRRHRSRSSSRDRRRRDDREREKRRDRRDDDDRKKRSRRDDDDDRRESSSRKEKISTRSRVKEEPPEDETLGVQPEGSPVFE